MAKASTEITYFLQGIATDAALYKTCACVYANTPGEYSVIDNYDENISLVGGLSGHGYKMSNVLGRCAVELSLNNYTSIEISSLFKL